MTNPIAINLAQQVREVHTGGNWTAVNIQDTLTDVDLSLALKKRKGFNTIATLVYHITYFYEVVIPVMTAGPLQGKDTLSFDHPPLHTEGEWQALIQNALEQAETLAALLEDFPDEKLGEDFVDPKYGTYYRNFSGLIAHTHYHLGQIVILKKLLN